MVPSVFITNFMPQIFWCKNVYDTFVIYISFCTMVSLYFVNITDVANAYNVGLRLNELPSDINKKVISYKSREEQLSRICGKLLLSRLLSESGLGSMATLADLSYNEYAKPYMHADVDFSIAHSGSVVICALSKEYKIGVDVEKIKETEISIFKDHFTCGEWSYIANSPDPLTGFYNLWVRKEAVMKATGKGIFQSATETDASKDQVVIEKTAYFIKDIFIKDGYAACVATQEKGAEIVIKEIDMNMLLDMPII